MADVRAQLLLRMPPALKARLEECAQDAGVSTTAWVLMALRRAARSWDAGVTPRDGRRGRRGARLPSGARWSSGWPRELACPVCSSPAGQHDPAGAHQNVSAPWLTEIEALMRADAGVLALEAIQTLDAEAAKVAEGARA